jgi:hypothetical protein
MKTQDFGIVVLLSSAFSTPSSSLLSLFLCPFASSLKNYRDNRENGAPQDNPNSSFPSAGIDALDIENSTWQGADKWPDAQGRYWWKLTLKNGQFNNDFYWMEDKARGFPDKSNSDRYWFTVHHAPSNTIIEGFSQEKGADGRYYIRFTDIHCPAIRLWMRNKDINYLHRLQKENPALYAQEIKTAHPDVQKIVAQEQVEQEHKAKAEAERMKQQKAQEQARLEQERRAKAIEAQQQVERERQAKAEAERIKQEQIQEEQDLAKQRKKEQKELDKRQQEKEKLELEREIAWLKEQLVLKQSSQEERKQQEAVISIKKTEKEPNIASTPQTKHQPLLKEEIKEETISQDSLFTIGEYDFINQEIYSGWVTDLELAVFSATVYRSAEEHNDLMPTKFTEDKRLQWWKALQNSGWSVFQSQQGDDGFQAMAYRHDERKQMVIAFRGTDRNQPVTLWIDWKEVCKNTKGSHGKQACAFVHRIQQALIQEGRHTNLGSTLGEFREGDYQITLTGHSLGAWLASIASSVFGYTAIVFDNPGARNIIEEYRGGQIHEGLHDQGKFRILNYQAMPNLINTAHPQVGRVLQLETAAPKRTHIGLAVKEIDYTLSQHSIDLMVEVFNPKTGMPDAEKVKRAKSWPGKGAQIAQELVNLFPRELGGLCDTFCRYWFSAKSPGDLTSHMKLAWSGVQSLISLGGLAAKIINNPEETVRKMMEAFGSAYTTVSTDHYLNATFDAPSNYNEAFDQRFKGHYRVLLFNPQYMPILFIPGAIIECLHTLADFRDKKSITLPEHHDDLINMFKWIRKADGSHAIDGIKILSQSMSAVDFRRIMMKELPMLFRFIEEKQKLSTTPALSMPDFMTITIPYEEITLGVKRGEGAFGEVYEGQWHYENVAVKKLHVQRLSDNAVKEFKAEAAIMARFRSDYIVTLKGVCLTPYAIVMEYMRGGSLFDLLHRDAPLPWTIRHRLATDIAKGLFFLHQHNPVVIHRDLKTHNVLLTHEFRAKLSDFGLSKVRVESTRSHTHTPSTAKSVGTIPWMAPESLDIEPIYSEKSDMYAYGMVLWEIATRKMPYENVANPNIIINAVLAGRRPQMPEETVNPAAPLPTSYKELIRVCWFQAPEKRPTAKEAIETLEIDNPTTSSTSSTSNSSSYSSFLSNFSSKN